MLSNQTPGAKKGCSIGGKCEKCPHYRSMPVDVTDPTTGEVIQQGTVWDCVFAWIMLGSWDSGRQTQNLHAGVNQAQNEANKRQEQLFGFVTGNMLQRFPAKNTEVIEGAES